MKEKFKLKDNYDFDNAMTIGYYNTMREVKKACKAWDLETDGECSFELRKLDKNGKYTIIIKDWYY